MNDDPNVVQNAGAKVAAVWIGVGASLTWTDIAAILGSLYTVLLITEWCWKKFLRDAFEARGWVGPRKPRPDDTGRSEL